jgi:hypothetical protein
MLRGNDALQSLSSPANCPGTRLPDEPKINETPDNGTRKTNPDNTLARSRLMRGSTRRERSPRREPSLDLDRGP